MRAAEAALVPLVVRAAAQEPTRLFSYHPLLAVAGTVSAVEALGVAVEARRQTGAARRALVVSHWRWAVAALTLHVCAFAVAYINKDLHNKVHFKSNHAW